jgi:hypothetical protein
MAKKGIYPHVKKVENCCIVCGEPLPKTDTQTRTTASYGLGFLCFFCHLKEGGKTKADRTRLFGSGSFVKKDKLPTEGMD